MRSINGEKREVGKQTRRGAGKGGEVGGKEMGKKDVSKGRCRESRQ